MTIWSDVNVSKDCKLLQFFLIFVLRIPQLDYIFL